MWPLLLFVLVGLFLPCSAAAQERCSTARDQKEFLRECRSKAEALRQVGDWQQALATYEQAYKEVPTPRLLLPMAELLLQLERPQEGLSALERYLREMPPEEISPEQRAQAEALQGKLLALKDQQERLRLEQELALQKNQQKKSRSLLPHPALKWTLGGAGLLLGGVGGALLGMDGRLVCGMQRGQMEYPHVLRTDVPGISLLAVGGAAVVSSVVMLAIELHVRKRQQRQEGSSGLPRQARASRERAEGLLPQGLLRMEPPPAGLLTAGWPLTAAPGR